MTVSVGGNAYNSGNIEINGKMKWINIKDKIPELFVDVLVFTHGHIEIRHRIDEVYPDDAEICNKIAWSEQGFLNDIHFWMPLPLPPIEDK